MAKFRSKLVEIEAQQWFPGKDVPGVQAEECWAEIGGRGHGRQRFRQPDKHYVITIHGQKTYLEPGDWVVTESRDSERHYPVKPEDFDRRWEPIA
jgi:hypothetical protein